MIEEAIGKAVEGEELGRELSRAVMLEMMEGRASAGQIGSFITAMRMKGESESELASFLEVMREKSQAVSAPAGAVDLCGTGGDCAGTFNISTAATFVVAGAGVPVAKHGNSSVSSRSGSADVLSSMGIEVSQPPDVVERCMKDTGVGFMYAPVFHRSMKNVQLPRKEIGIRTFFNLLGPMSNPAGVERQLVGVYDPDLAPVMSRVLKRMGSSRVMVVHGDGMDEITNTGCTRVVELSNGHIKDFEVSPEDFGLETADRRSIKGGGPQENARIMRSIFKGEHSPRTDIVALNAGAVLYLAGRADTMEEGVELAFQTIEEGGALQKLNQFLEFMKAQEPARPEYSVTYSPRGLKSIGELVEELRRIEKGQEALSAIDRDVVRRPNMLTEVALNRALSFFAEDGGVEEAKSRSGSLSGRLREEPHLSVIAEYKPRSPSQMFPPRAPSEIASAYQSAGVSAISVLMEPQFFGGGVQHFRTIRSRVDLPMLYKDFVMHPEQLIEARSVGADAVLLIAKLLNLQSLDGLAGECLSMGMEPLVEIHDARDLKKLEGCEHYDSIELLGVNTRDLQTMNVDLSRLRSMRDVLPEGKLLIGESGVSTPDDLRQLRGYDAVLIGSLLMNSERPGETTRAVVERAREVFR